MYFERVTENRQVIEVNLKRTLQAGQIIRANIARLFPEGKALINLGNQQLIAQLEAALAVGKSYHFQVLQADNQRIHLKVLSEVTPDGKQDLKNLLTLFDFNVSTSKVNFLKSLIDDRISFNKGNLSQAFQILKGVPQPEEASFLLKQMMSKGLPITENTFNALQTVNKTELTTLLRQLNSSIQEKDSESLGGIKTLLNRPQELSQQFLLNKITRDNLLPLFRSLGFQMNSEPIDQPAREAALYLNHFSLSSVNEIISSIINKEQILMNESKNLLHRFQQLPQIDSPEFDQKVSHLRHQFQEKILPHLSPEHRAVFSQIAVASKITSEELSRMMGLLETLVSSRTYGKLKSFKRTLNYDFARENFSVYIKQGLSELGFTYEKELANNNFSYIKQETLKGQALQLLNTAEFANHEQIQQILHFINGAQIQSIQETNHFIQANLILLGEQFEFDKDIHINFESKKTKDGKIDPDFCRILFFLDLDILRETVIDMHVQNRLITIQVFNKLPNLLMNLSKNYEDKLNSSLEKINYTLSKISFAPFKEEDQSQGFLLKETRSKEGIDFRV